MLGVAFTSTINLGAVLTAMLLLMGFAWASRRQRGEERWRGLYELADAERKETKEHLSETRAQLDEALRQIADQKDIIGRLEAMQMPTKVMEVMELHESRSTEQHEKTLTVLHMIAERLGPEPNGH